MDIEDWTRRKPALVSRAHHNGQWRCGANVSVSEVPVRPGYRRFVAGPDHTNSTESGGQLGGGGELMLLTAEVAIVFQRALEQLIAAVVELAAVLAQV